MGIFFLVEKDGMFLYTKLACHTVWRERESESAIQRQKRAETSENVFTERVETLRPSVRTRETFPSFSLVDSGADNVARGHRLEDTSRKDIVSDSCFHDSFFFFY